MVTESMRVCSRSDLYLKQVGDQERSLSVCIRVYLWLKSFFCRGCAEVDGDIEKLSRLRFRPPVLEN